MLNLGHLKYDKNSWSPYFISFIQGYDTLYGSMSRTLIGKQEYSSRTLGATWGIISAVMLPIVIVLICIGWRILKRRKAEEKEEIDYMIKTRPLDPDESKINSDDESIPYKKAEESPLPTDPVKVVDTNVPFTYGQPYTAQPYQAQGYEPEGFESEPYNEPGLPGTSLPETGLPETGLPQNKQKQWTGETEIN